MININYGQNHTILSACRPLDEYAWFVAQIRKNHSAGNSDADNLPMRFGDSVDKAVDEMPDDFEIKKFISANRSEGERYVPDGI